jgi:hypothetical protein
VRQENNNKFIVIGIFPVDIVVPHVPADVFINFYVELGASPGEKGTVFVRVSDPSQRSVILKMDYQAEGPIASLYGPRLSLRLEKEGVLKIEFGESAEQYDLSLERQVKIGSIASVPLFLQSPPAAPASSAPA